MKKKIDRKFLKEYFRGITPMGLFKLDNGILLKQKLDKKQQKEFKDSGYNEMDMSEVEDILFNDYTYNELLSFYKENNPDVECVLTEDEFYFLDTEGKKKYLNIKDDDYWWTDKQLNDIYKKRMEEK